MTREQVRSIFADATDDQVNQLLNIHSADIGKAKSSGDKLQADLDSVKNELATAKATISQLEASKGDVEALQKQIDDYKAADKKRAEDAAAAAEKAELEERFGIVANGKTFIHDMVKAGVLADFGAALKDKTNRGKSDAEIFEQLTKDKGYFSSQAPNVPSQPKLGNVGAGEVKTREDFFKMSFADQMKYKEAHNVEYKQLFHME